MKKSSLSVVAVLVFAAGWTLVGADTLPPVKVEGQMSAARITMPTPVTTPQAHHKKKKWVTNGFGGSQPASFGPTRTPTPALSPTPTIAFESGRAKLN